MRRGLFLLLILLVNILFTAHIVFAAFRRSQIPTWYEFAPQGGGFTVQLPAATPEHVQVPVPSKPGSFNHRYIVGQAASTEDYYEIQTTDYPKPAYKFANIEDITAAAVKQYTDGGFRVDKESTTILQGCAGREILYTHPRDTYLRIRYFLSGERLYAIVFRSTQASKIHAQDAELFFDSFKLTNPTCKKVQWKLFSPHSDEFTVLMPVEPQISKSPTGKVPLYVAEVAGAHYIVGVIQYPIDDKAYDPVTIERVFDKSQDALISILGPSLALERKDQHDISLGEYRGREVTLGSPRLAGRIRMYVAPRRLYFVAALMPKVLLPNEDLEKFLESFRIMAIKQKASSSNQMKDNPRSHGGEVYPLLVFLNRTQSNNSFNRTRLKAAFHHHIIR